MSDGIEQKVVNMLDALEKGAVHVGDVVVKYSPDVAEATLMVVRIDGVSSIATGVVAGVLCYLWFVWANKLRKKADEASYADSALFGTASVVCFVGSVVAFSVSMINLLDVWNWVAVFEPKLYLAKQIIKAAVGG